MSVQSEGKASRKVGLQELRLIDYERCMGCGTCESVCGFIHDDRPYIKLYELYPGLVRPISCFHCSKAPCIEACPTGAMSRDPETGAVYVETTRCIGCMACLYACPFGIPEFSRVSNTATKCDLCRKLMHEGLRPACAAMCPAEAIVVAPPEEVGKDVRVRVLKKIVLPKLEALEESHK